VLSGMSIGIAYQDTMMPKDVEAGRKAVLVLADSQSSSLQEPGIVGLVRLSAIYQELESTINVVAAGAAFVALRVSTRPADSNHPYGHHKAEYFSAVFEGVLVVVAAFSIFRSANLGFLAPKPLEAPIIGLAINAGASFINGVWAWLLLSWGRRWQSPALVADGRHVMADVLTSGGVIIGVALVSVTGWLVLDSIVAMLVGVNILWSGFKMVREGLAALWTKRRRLRWWHALRN
jgi:cation diffusion facilitator family transporter